jgi:aryl-alcohol dehydrogenase-like predicted oxidoreductase
MKYRGFGATGFKTSEIGFGAWAIGGQGYGPADDQQSLNALELAFEKGVNFFDTADTYGEGHSEVLISEFLQGKKREDVFLATKVGWNFYEKPTRKCFEENYVRQCCEKSLRRLKTDAIDLYQLHNPSLKHLEEFKPQESLRKLKQEGKIRFSGISVHREEEALKVLQEESFDAIQLVLNFLDQRMLDRVICKASEKKVAVIVREPLASGLLSGKYSASFQFEKGDHRRRWAQEKREADFEKIKLISNILETENLNLVHQAIEFVLSVPEVSVVIPGMKNTEQVEENVSPSDVKQMTYEQIQSIKEIFKNQPIFKTALNPS